MGWVVAYTIIGITMLLLARLSRRMGTYTHVQSWYRVLYAAAVLLWIGALVRLVFQTQLLAELPEIVQNSLYVLLANALPAVGITLALLVAWYYWSWLLAERD